MNQHDINRNEFEKNVNISNADQGRFWEMDRNEPKRSPMRRKDKPRTGGIQLKSKRDHKKKHFRLKYEW